MSLPREPRQKMINMMYLVLTALLALNVSSEILNAFKTVNNSLEKTNEVVSASTNEIMTSLKDKMGEAGAAEKAKIWYPKAQQVQDYSKKMYEFIDELKKKKCAFKHVVRNESTCREFISAFMTTAVKCVQSMEENLQLKAEEWLDGSRGYGPTDYAVYVESIIALVAEVKKEDFEKGAAQNIVQMCSAVEVRRLLYTIYYYSFFLLFSYVNLIFIFLDINTKA